MVVANLISAAEPTGPGSGESNRYVSWPVWNVEIGFKERFREKGQGTGSKV